MENEEGRKEYLVFPPSKNQCPASSQKGRKIPLKGNGRRIDYILYSDDSIQQDWKMVDDERDDEMYSCVLKNLNWTFTPWVQICGECRIVVTCRS